jgi:DNA mismatch endonuclease (patch repair protein)
MTDRLSREARSRNMARIRGTNTRPEMLVRSELHAAGLRFRLHVRKLPGRPDIVLPRRGSVVFVHGCFWHRHPGCKLAATPSTNRDFWIAKFAENVARDARNDAALRAAGWKVYTIWECQAYPGSVGVRALIARLIRKAGAKGLSQRSTVRNGVSPPHDAAN